MINGFLCSPRLYEYDGWFFELGRFPWPLKKNGDPRANAGRDFYKMFDRFSKLSKDEQEGYRVGGECMTIGGNGEKR